MCACQSVSWCRHGEIPVRSRVIDRFQDRLYYFDNNQPEPIALLPFVVELIVKLKEQEIYAKSLRYAVASGNLSMLAWLIELGLDINAIDDGETVSTLHEAIKSGNLSMLTWLIELGLNVNATNEDGETVLMLAVALDRADVLSILLAAGAIPVSVSEFNDENCISVSQVCSAEVLKKSSPVVSTQGRLGLAIVVLLSKIVKFTSRSMRTIVKPSTLTLQTTWCYIRRSWI
jgi:hypothetical protein